MAAGSGMNHATGSTSLPHTKGCTLDALNCASFATNGLIGMKLHEVVYKAGLARRYAEAICLAQNSINSADKWLAGASYYETSLAWDGLGCRANAISAIEASLGARPNNKNGWNETCARCVDLKASCGLCQAVKSERIECPGISQLAMDVGTVMTKQAPSDATWTNPKVEMCIPIGLPHPGWYVLAWVQQDSPDREFWFHIAVDARTSKTVAISEAEQRKYNYVCDTKFGKVDDHAGAPSTVSMSVTCFDKMENSSTSNLDAEIAPPKIILHPRK
ncbi:MAG: hypothetical protein H0T79_02925 [Deltaproteobacteria bacterium]|nr:hypothetical protein [Deltaproteobacteria bacterium]